MRISYRTGIATFIQFVIGAGLTFISGVASIIGGCYGTSSTDCVGNSLVSLILILFGIGFYGFLAALGYTTQERRSTRLALLLIGIEVIAVLVFAFDAKQTPAIIDRLSNAVSAAIAIWVIVVAGRLWRSKGSRIVKARTRH